MGLIKVIEDDENISYQPELEKTELNKPKNKPNDLSTRTVPSAGRHDMVSEHTQDDSEASQPGETVASLSGGGDEMDQESRVP